MTAEFDDVTDGGVLPEVSEADAPDSVRAIYREIRKLSGVPMAGAANKTTGSTKATMISLRRVKRSAP